MRCETVRDRLADYLTGGTGGWTTGRLRRHLDRCEACAGALRDEEALEARLASWEDEDVPEAVWLRIRDVASAPLVSDAPPVGWRERLRAGVLRYALPYALGAATTALLVLALAGGPEDRPGTAPATPPAPAWASEAAPALRPGEEALVLERPSEGILIIRDPSYRRILERLREEGLRPRSEEPDPAEAVPAGYVPRTH